MNILILSLWYYPEPVTKPHDLATELVRRGHTVTVITSFPNYPGGNLYPGYRQRFWQRETLDDVKVIRIPVRIDRSRSGNRRVLSFATYATSATFAGAFVKPKPDVVWTYQIGMPGVAVAKLRRAKLVHEVQDLWPEWAVSGGLGIGDKAYDLLNREEKAVYRHATAITTISAGFQQKLVEKGVPLKKINVIPNWANEQHFYPNEPDNALAEREGLAGCFNVIYGGNIGTAQGLGVVLDAAELLRDSPSIQFVLIGDGLERPHLARQVAERGISNIRLLGSRLPDQMAGYYGLANVLLLHLNRDPVYDLTVPSKTYAYLASGRPLLVAATGEAARLIRDLGAGVVCPPEDPVALAGAVRKLYDMSSEQRAGMGVAGREAFLLRYTRQVLGDRYEALFKGLVFKPSAVLSRSN